METRELTCICCPMGCSMTAEIENHEVVKVTGNTCPRGAAYAKKEITSPSRTVTSSVHVTHGKLLMASVKTKEEVPKERIMDVMEVVRNLTVEAPVTIGQVLVEDCAGTGVEFVATRNVDVV